MTDLYLSRKCAGLCTKCGAPASATSVLCEAHRVAAAASVQRHQRAVRKFRRLRGLCVDCGTRTSRYRCLACSLQIKIWRGAIALGAET